MKKLVIFALVLSMIAVALSGCSSKPEYFTGEWKFSKMIKVELVSDVTEERTAELMQEYGAEDMAGLEESVIADLVADKIFDPYYLNFDKKYTYTYDPIMEREATWVFYQTGGNEGFISFYAELDAAEGNPDPRNNPMVSYNAEKGTLIVTLNFSAFMVTVELSR